MTLDQRIDAFSCLGDILKNPNPEMFPALKNELFKLNELIGSINNFNPWFTAENVSFSLKSVAGYLEKEKLKKWISGYNHEKFFPQEQKTIGVVMAGNIPLVGFHDFLSIMISGHKILIKLSLNDNKLLPLICETLYKIDVEFSNLISFTDVHLKNFDAIIATGSNNTSHYFEYYFGKYPHIIRKNRNGIAILTGDEDDFSLKQLGHDIFQYFGLGCRSISKLFIPEGYSFEKFFTNLEQYSYVKEHHKYKNNYDYNKAIFIINNIVHQDNGFLLLKEDKAISSPVSVLFYEYYSDSEKLNRELDAQKEKIQCIVSGNEQIKNRTPFGKAQMPDLWDYSDNTDTLKFLINL